MAKLTDTELLDFFTRAYVLKTMHEQGVRLHPGMNFNFSLTLELLGHRVTEPTLRDCLHKVFELAASEIMALKLEN
jgi:hypothetical protein